MSSSSFSVQHPALFNARNFEDPQKFCLSLFEQYGITPPASPASKIIEIGGSISNNAGQLFPHADFINLDISPSEKVKTLICDVTKEIPLEDNSVDFVYSHDAFEHISKPWIAARNIERILKPGGVVFIATIFAWRYHPVPKDYWRFSHEGLVELFDGLECLEANFNAAFRRLDARGFWESKQDSVPIDQFGGWRENWKVYYFGRKPAAAMPAF